MGLLLLQYEYQRANNQYNLCERTGIRLNNKVTTYTKRVESMQNMFTKAQSKLENSWTNQINKMNTNISQAAALATSSHNWETFVATLRTISINGINLGKLINVTAPSNMQDASAVASAITAAAGQVSQQLQTIANEYKEADLALLQEQQDQQLQPIAEKETEYENQKNTNEVLTTLWEQRRDNAKERLGKDIQNGVAKYGIGQ